MITFDVGVLLQAFMPPCAITSAPYRSHRAHGIGRSSVISSKSTGIAGSDTTDADFARDLRRDDAA